MKIRIEERADQIIICFETIEDRQEGIEKIKENKILNRVQYITYKELCKSLNLMPQNSVYNPNAGWTKDEINDMVGGKVYNSICKDDYFYISLPAPHSIPINVLRDIAAFATVIDDSGERISYGEGKAVREPSDGKGRYDLISPFGLQRLARRYELGAKKYSDRNWENGIPFSRYIDSAMRHLNKYMMGMNDEDHLAAAAWNIIAIMHHEELGQSKELDDLPHYLFKEASKLYDGDVDKDIEKLRGQLVDPERMTQAVLNAHNNMTTEALNRLGRCCCEIKPDTSSPENPML